MSALKGRRRETITSTAANRMLFDLIVKPGGCLPNQIRVFGEDDQFDYECEICLLQFETEGVFNLHMSAYHSMFVRNATPGRKTPNFAKPVLRSPRRNNPSRLEPIDTGSPTRKAESQFKNYTLLTPTVRKASMPIDARGNAEQFIKHQKK